MWSPRALHEITPEKTRRGLILHCSALACFCLPLRTTVPGQLVSITPHLWLIRGHRAEGDLTGDTYQLLRSRDERGWRAGGDHGHLFGCGLVKDLGRRSGGLSATCGERDLQPDAVRFSDLRFIWTCPLWFFVNTNLCISRLSDLECRDK